MCARAVERASGHDVFLRRLTDFIDHRTRAVQVTALCVECTETLVTFVRTRREKKINKLINFFTQTGRPAATATAAANVDDFEFEIQSVC